MSPTFMINQSSLSMDAIQIFKTMANTDNAYSILKTYESHAVAMDVLLLKLLIGQLQNLKVFNAYNSIEEIKQCGLILPDFRPWFTHSLNLLMETGALVCHGQFYKMLEPIDIAQVWQDWAQEKLVWTHFPDILARATLAETIIRAIPQILNGEITATQMMFPNGSFELLETLYKDNLIADYFNEILTNILITSIRHRLASNSNAMFRILEIGAGTGGTTDYILKKLHPYQQHIEEYCYSDLSKAFLIRAQKRYSEYGFLNYKRFNIELSPIAQGIHVEHYDMVIAANVLHATRDMDHTMRQVKAF